MSFTTAKYPQDAPRGSVEKGAADQVNAATVYALSRALTAAGCTTGTTTTKVKTANTLTFTVNGVFYSLAGTDDFWTLSGTVVKKGSYQKYLLLVDTAGVASIQEGTQSTVGASSVVWTNVDASTAWAAFLSALGSTKCCAGVLTIATDATHTFTPGTTALDAAGITATFVDGLDQSILPLIATPTGQVFGTV